MQNNTVLTALRETGIATAAQLAQATGKSQATISRLLREVDAQIVALTGSFDDIVAAAEQSNVDDEHDPEGTTIAFERQQVAALLRQAKVDREALLVARDHVEQPSYGVCE